MQIQTVKTQEMNLLREQQEALTAELSQRRAEYEALSAQRDDLASQLQVAPRLHRWTPSSRETFACLTSSCLQESSFANRKLLEQLTEEGREKDRLLVELDEAKKVQTRTHARTHTRTHTHSPWYVLCLCACRQRRRGRPCWMTWPFR